MELGTRDGVWGPSGADPEPHGRLSVCLLPHTSSKEHCPVMADLTFTLKDSVSCRQPSPSNAPLNESVKKSFSKELQMKYS